MANEVTIGGDGSLFIGEDKTLDHEVLDVDGAPVDINGWTIKFTVRTSDGAADPVVIEKTASIIGTYSAVRTSNTQRARVALTDDDTNTLTARGYRYSFKRTDDGSETVTAFGPFRPQMPATR